MARGVGLEVERRMREAGAIGTERAFWASWDPETIKKVCLDLAEEAGLDMLLHTLVVGVLGKGRKPTGIVVENKSGRRAILAKVIIDATGDGDVASKAGAPYVFGDEKGKTLPMTLMFNLRNVDKSRAKKYLNPSIKDFLRTAIEQKEVDWSIGLGQYDGQPGVCAAPMVHEDEVTIWGGTIEGLNGVATEDLTKAERLARRHASILLSVLRRHAPGFEKATLATTASQVGVRESRRILGEYYMTLQDAAEGKKFDDRVGYVEYGKWKYWVPYRMLVPKKVDSMLVAGRCISAERELMFRAGLREIPASMVTGQAAGTAAALCARFGTSPRRLSVPKLQEELAGQAAVPA